MAFFDWFALLIILIVACAGGYYPLFRPEQARRSEGLPLGQAFAAGVFLALSLTIMLPNGFHLFAKMWPDIHYPIASLFALGTFISLLALAHAAYEVKVRRGETDNLAAPTVPIIMTVMIAIPSFLLGTALGVSGKASALLILIAVLAHKGSAGFALALAMVRSTMTRPQVFTLYAFFAFATPVGILVGMDVHEYLSGPTMTLVKAIILSLASGVFLFMGTLHELRHTPMIKHCCTLRGFVVMIVGVLLTAFVRFLLGLGHTGHLH
jgi:solute carrier family 39 (zinc transporter), member 1/2/3